VGAAEAGARIPAGIGFVALHFVHPIVAFGDVTKGARRRLKGIELRRDKADELGAARVEQCNKTRPQRRHRACPADNLIRTIDPNDVASLAIRVARDVRHAAADLASGVD